MNPMKSAPTLLIRSPVPGATACVVACLAMAACDAPRVSEAITGVKVLAIQAEPASAQPGEEVTLRALVVSPDPDEEIELRWFVCQYPSLDECATADDLIEIGQGPRIDAAIPESAFPGDTFAFWLDVTARGSIERSVKAVPVRVPPASINRNPMLDRVRWSDSSVPEGEAITLRQKDRARVWVGSSVVINEIYDDSGTPASESVQLRTYTTGGELFDASGSGASGALLYRAPEKNGEFGAWVIAVDGRGGVDWTHQRFRVEGKQK